jgi:hypothetical protein
MVTISPLPEKKRGGSKGQESFGPRTRAKTLLSLQVPRWGGGFRGWVSLIQQVNPYQMKIGINLAYNPVQRTRFSKKSPNFEKT